MVWYLFDSFGSAVEIYQFAATRYMLPESAPSDERGSVIERLLIDELLDGFLGDLMAAHKLLDLLVRLVHARQAGKFAGAHGGLDRLAKHLPVGVQLGFDGDVVRMDGVQTAHQIVEREHGVAQRGADVALRGGIGQIALPTGFDQRCGQRVEQRAGDLQIGFRVFRNESD